MKKILVLLLSVLLTVTLIGCGSEPPPDDGSKEPPALNGAFQCRGYGRFVFNGDGKSIDMKVTKELADATGLPEGLNAGSYVFLFNGALWRYDRSDAVQITVKGENYRVNTLPGGTDEKRIELLTPDGKTFLFEKED